jgi:imidazolonepropionase-like amidohydrolase
MRVRRLLLSAALCVTGPAGLLAQAPTAEAPAAHAPAADAPAPVACPAGAILSRVHAYVLASRAGFQTTCVFPDGGREIFFAYNDRGRGPSLRTRVALEANGLPVSVETTGNDYLKAPVSERFSIAAGVGTWKNKAEEGKRKLGRPAYYASFSAPPAELGLLARALLRVPRRRLPLLPEGEAHLETIGPSRLTSGGQTVQLTHYALSGLDFEPADIWLDEKNELFATTDGWATLVPEGWESSADELKKLREERGAARRAEQARRLRRVPAKPVVFTGANLFDASGGAMRPKTTVVISGTTITAVGPDGAVAIPRGAKVIAARGKALLPGLFDMHTHIGLDEGLLHLSCGVTSVRDMAAEPDKAAKLRAFETGAALGPRVTFAGIIDGSGPFHAPTKTLVDTEPEARAAVRAIAAAGYGQVKIYSSVKPELVPPIADEAHRLGLRVMGHVPAFMTAEEAVRAGFDEIQHLNMVFLNFFAGAVKDTRTPARFTAVAERAAELDLDSERVRSFLALLEEKHVVIDPTVNIFEGMFTARPGQPSPVYAAVTDRLPAQVRRGFLAGGLSVPEGKDGVYRASFRAMLRMLARLHRQGISIVVGTDGLAGFTLPREMELYVEAGIPAPSVLQMATLGAARVAGRADRLGSIEPGKLADLVLIDGDPSLRIGDIRHVRLVVKDGALFDVDAMDRDLGVRPEARRPSH